MEAFLDFMDGTLLDVSYWKYAGALGAIFGGFLCKWLTTIVLKVARKATSKTSVKFDDLVIEAFDRPLGWVFVVIGLYAAVAWLPFPTEPVDVSKFLIALLKGTGALLFIWFCIRLADGLSKVLLERAKKTSTKLDDQLIPIASRSLKVFLVMLGAVLFLQNLGYSVSSLIAGVGISGAALAFAAKDTLGNVFGVFVIFMDRPFQVGDWIQVGSVEGTVEDIGMRVTRIRTFANSVVSLPNSTFTTNPINNWSRMKKRRIKMTVGITYDAKPEQVEQAVEKIRQLIRDDENIHDDFFLVNFDGFGASSLDIFIYCFTRTTNWGEFLDAKQKFMLDIMRVVDEMGLEMAFPTQTLHVASLPQDAGSMQSQRPA